MGGGLMQLVAYGAQDVYLTGEPQITFFKVVYRRHTNFAIESIKQTFNGTANWSSEVSATIARNGDLVTGMHLEGKFLLEIDSILLFVVTASIFLSSCSTSSPSPTTETRWYRFTRSHPWRGF